MKSFMKRLIGVPLLLAAGTLLAQPSPPPSDPPTTQSPPTDITLTVAEMNLRIADYEKQVNDANRIVLTLQAQARKEKDVIKLTCINDKLLQMKAIRNMFDTDKAIFDGSEDAEKPAPYGRVEKHSGDLRKLKEEAQACAGEVELPSDQRPDFTGPQIPDDPSDPLFPPYLEPPGYASPWS